MQTVLAGGSITLTGFFYNQPGGALTNPDTISLSVYNADTNTLVAGPLAYPGSLTRTSLGTYQYIWTVPALAVLGNYVAQWTTTYAGQTENGSESFLVTTGPSALVTLDDVKAHLNMDLLDAEYDDELQGFMYGATEVIQDIVGPCVPTSFTEYFDGGVGSVVLSNRPVLFVTSVKEVSGTTTFNLTEQPLGGVQDGFGFTVDYTTGQLTRRIMGGGSGFFPDGTKNVWVVYTAGRNTVPDNVRLAALELIRHLWQFGQQGNRPPFGAGVDEQSYTPGFAIPNRVLELLKPQRRTPGVG